MLREPVETERGGSGTLPTCRPTITGTTTTGLESWVGGRSRSDRPRPTAPVRPTRTLLSLRTLLVAAQTRSDRAEDRRRTSPRENTNDSARYINGRHHPGGATGRGAVGAVAESQEHAPAAAGIVR